MLMRLDDIPKDKVWVTAVTNPFRPHDDDSRMVRFLDYTGSDVRSYIKEIFPLIPKDLDVEVCLNGKRIGVEDGVTPTPGDNLVFCLMPAGGDSDNALRTIAMLAVIIIATYVSYGGAGAYFGIGAIGEGTAGAAILGAAIALGGTLLVNAILPPTTPDESEQGDSPTYGWGAGFNRDVEGYPIPILYGTHRVFSPIIARHVSVNIEGDAAWNVTTKELLNLLLSVADHPVDSIESVEINNNPMENYEWVSATKRLGTNTQQPCYRFRDTITETSVGTRVPLNGDWSVAQRTSGNSVEGLVVGVSFPSGLYYSNDSGGMGICAVWLHIQYRKVGDAEWTDFPGYSTYQYGTWNGTELYGFLIQAATATPGVHVFRVSDLTPGEYDVRIRYAASYAHLYGGRDHFDTYFAFLQEVIPDDFEYPGMSLIAISGMATDQLSGQEPAISVLATRSTVDVWVPAVGWRTKAANNPAWAAYDMLVNKEYGGGVSPSRMVYADFLAWATACDDNSREFNAYIDTAAGLREMLTWPETIGRARVVQKGTDFGVILDEQSSPVQLFSYGNIVENSFKEVFLSKAERVNCLELTFFDAEDNYQRKTLELRTSTYDSDSDLDENKRAITLFGCTSRETALKHGKFLLNCNQYLKRRVEFDVGVDALGCRVGEVIYVAHDLPQWGYSGRIVSATSNTVVLDREVTLTPGTSYQVLVRHSGTDELETQSITTPGVETTTDTLTLTGSWTTTPSLHDVYSFGAVNYVAKKFRVSDISRSKDQTRKIKALEYVDEVYDDAVTVPAEEPYPTTVFVRDLAVTEIWESGQGIMRLTWRGETLQWYIFYRETGTDHWIKAGEAVNRVFDVRYLNPGMTYDFAVSGRNNPGYGETVTANFYGYGKTEFPIPTVSAIAIVGRGAATTWLEKDLQLEWAIASFTFPEAAGDEQEGAGTLITNVPSTYKIQILNPDLTVRREESLDVNYYNYTYANNTVDGGGTPAAALTIKVWATDNYGRVSEEPAVLSVTNPAPDNITGLRIASTGSTSAFNTRDIDLTWFASDNPDIKNYKVTIYDGSLNERRTVYVTDPQFVYSYDMNLEDGALASTIVVKVWAQDAFNQFSATADQETFVNALPDNVSGLIAEAFIRGVTFYWSSNTDKDFDHYKYRLKVGTNSWGAWQTTPSTQVNRNLTDAEQISFDGQAYIYIEVLAVDSFGAESMTAATANAQTLTIDVQATDINDFALHASKLWLNIPMLEGDSWSDNDPSSGQISYTAHTLYYGGAAYSIEAGSTANKYVYWVNGDTAYSFSDTNPTLSDGDFIIAVNIEGVHDLAWHSNANQVIGSAYIEKLAVLDEHVGNVAAEKITAGIINGMTITGSVLQTAPTGKRVIINSDGITLHVTSAVGKYGTFKYGDGTHYGTGAVAYIHHSAHTVPFYIAAEQTVGDFHFFERTSDPTGAAEVGDICMVNGVLRKCTVAGTPGTWADA